VIGVGSFNSEQLMAGRLYDIWWATGANEIDTSFAYAYTRRPLDLAVLVVWYGVMLDVT
jgi:hypothetical protein